MATTENNKKQPRNPQYITPKGTFVYPYLVTPDHGTGTFTNANGVYKVNLRLTEAEAEELIAKLQPIYDEAIAKGQAEFDALPLAKRKKMGDMKTTPLYEEEYDEETEEPTGSVIFKFATTASGTNKKTGKPWKRTIDLFSASGKKIKPAMVGGGTIGKVSFEANPYFIAGSGLAGLKLYLVAAQILELNSSMRGGGSAASYGFGAEEGYQDPEEDDDTPFDSDDDDTSDDSGDDDDF